MIIYKIYNTRHTYQYIFHLTCQLKKEPPMMNSLLLDLIKILAMYRQFENKYLPS